MQNKTQEPLSYQPAILSMDSSNCRYMRAKSGNSQLFIPIIQFWNRCLNLVLLFSQREVKLFPPLIVQKSKGTEMEYISNGKIKVTLFHPRTHRVKEHNYLSLEVFWSWVLLHRKLDFLPRCMTKWTISLIHNCPIIANLCLLLLNKDNLYAIIFLLVFSKPRITCFNRTSLWVAVLSICQ